MSAETVAADDSGDATDLGRLRAMFNFPFPLAYPQPTTGYGVDARTFANARYHAALDYALPHNRAAAYAAYPVICPGEATSSKWWGVMDSAGTTYLDLIGPGWRWRMAHFVREEMSTEALADALAGAGIGRGTPIGPAGDAGKAIGRHLHAALYLTPGVYDKALDQRWRAWHGLDMMPVWRKQYGEELYALMKSQGWEWANTHAAFRRDPWTKKPCFAVDWADLLWP